MNTLRRRILAVVVVAAGLVGPAVFGQVDKQLAIVDEKLDRLRAEVEALQFKQQQTEKQLGDLQAQINHLRQAGGADAAADVQALDARLRALDAAREKDKQIILDTLAKELARLGAARGTTAAAGSGAEYVVQKGENLTTIAKAHGVSVEDLKKANGLTDDTIRIGQKLVIPQ